MGNSAPRQKRSNSNTRGALFQRPQTISPWAKGAGIDSKSGSVWFSMKPKKIIDQFSKGAGTISTISLNSEFLFLAPLNLNENIVHHWEAYESVASRLAQKVRSAVKLGAEASALLGAGSKLNSVDTFKDAYKTAGQGEGQTIEKFANKVYNAVPGSKIPAIKIDTPLYYTNSDRRQIVLEFVLYQEHIPGKKAIDVLVNPIKELMKLSSPDLKDTINIDFPYMWGIKTVPNDFINYPTCALISVQPTWNSPYIHHLPSSVNLQLTFQDMSPLYRETIEKGSVINVISPTQARARQESNVQQRQKAGSQAQQNMPQVIRSDGQH